MDVVIVGACRTLIDNFGGAFKDLPANTLCILSITGPGETNWNRKVNGRLCDRGGVSPTVGPGQRR